MYACFFGALTQPSPLVTQSYVSTVERQLQCRAVSHLSLCTFRVSFSPWVDARVVQKCSENVDWRFCPTRLHAEWTSHKNLTGRLPDSGSDRIRPRLYPSFRSHSQFSGRPGLEVRPSRSCQNQASGEATLLGKVGRPRLIGCAQSYSALECLASHFQSCVRLIMEESDTFSLYCV